MAATATHFLSRGPLLAVGALVIASVVAVASWRAAGLPTRDADAPPVATRDLRFEDMADGGILVIDATSGATIEAIHGEQGFLRGSLRSLARGRRLHEVGPVPPFRLTARSDGALTLTDPSTGARIDLDSFGPTNAAVYRRWLNGATR